MAEMTRRYITTEEGTVLMMIRSFHSLMESYERLLARPNPADEHFYNGLYVRYRNPVLTREHIPPFWMYDADSKTIPS